MQLQLTETPESYAADVRDIVRLIGWIRLTAVTPDYVFAHLRIADWSELTPLRTSRLTAQAMARAYIQLLKRQWDGPPQ